MKFKCITTKANSRNFAVFASFSLALTQIAVICLVLIIVYAFILACNGMRRHKGNQGYGIALGVLFVYALVLIGLLAWSWNQEDSIQHVVKDSQRFFSASDLQWSDIWSGRILVALMAFQGVLNIVYSMQSVITKEIRQDSSDLHSFNEACCGSCIHFWAVTWFLIAFGMFLLAIFLGTEFYKL
ncbi:hypothetical protein HDV00_000127 [Rhizophlyctis rosea]|nr:hypothetical protein HDV00_000127 [Rhizophlyctis rosea]